jgi:ADP-heptose:LPS heptosyltransferase
MLRSIPHKKFISASHNFFFSSQKPPQGYKRPMMLRDRLLDLIQVATGKKQEVDVEMNIPQEWLVKSQEILSSLNPNKLPTVLLAPGAGGRFKCWPLANFINLAKQIKASGALPLFILGPAETEWQADIQKEIPNALFPLQMTTEKSVYLTIGLAALASACVANDGGVGHILASSNTFTISMWGPTDPLKSTPNGKNVKVVTSQQFGGNSMDYIPVRDIFDFVKSYLQSQ